jgi:hypothetical protein
MSTKTVVDARLIGDARARRAFRRLNGKLQKKIMRQVQRNSAKRMQPRIAAAAPVDTGTLQQELAQAKIRGRTRKGIILIWLVMPTREELGIPPRGAPGGSGYYPFSIEYGFTMRDGDFHPPNPFMRRTANQHADQERRRMSRELKAKTLREVKKGAG